jgi:3'-phosphoadenosine 5'-phosphosulfate sulfotransferase (PAPS reductase)/FAD synthetase
MTQDSAVTLDLLYKARNDLLTNDYEWDSDEVSEIERQIEEIEELPYFEEVISSLSCGRMKSIFGDCYD